jgi:signal transduction histidine kinase
MKHNQKTLNHTLGRRTATLALASHELQRGIVRRKSAEAVLKLSGEHCAKQLKESLQHQHVLRRLTHGVLRAQEDERQKISRELRDEIAQTLLGVNVRLLSLRTAIQAKTGNSTKEIASAQRLVVDSMQSIGRFARELDSIGKVHRPAPILCPAGSPFR